MKLLDLFCGAGGAAMGYHRAGFDEIVGIDIEPQPNYPFEFVQADAVYVAKSWDLDCFDLIHASPPCQRFSNATLDNNKHPDLIFDTRIGLEVESDTPFVIENVPTAPIRKDLILCGSHFGLDIQRHRVFEISGFFVMAPVCYHRWVEGRPWTVTGSGGGGKRDHSWKYRNLEHGKALMDMPWVQTRTELVEAIPPAYTEYIGKAFLEQTKGYHRPGGGRW